MLKRFPACLVRSCYTICCCVNCHYIEPTTISPRISYTSHHIGQVPAQYTAPWVPRHSPSACIPPTANPPHVIIRPRTGVNARIFRHTRDLSGIVGSEDTPSPKVNNPNLNAATNEYLWAHGYQGGTIRLIQQIYEGSETVVSFMERLTASGGISIAEAQYIHSLIESRTGRT